MERFERKLFIYIGAIAASALAFALGTFFVAGAIETHTKEIALQRSLVAGRAKSLEVLAGLKQNSKEVDTYGSLMDRLLPQREELLNFPRWLELFARSSQVGLNFAYQGSVNPPSAAGPGYIGFNIEATGNLDKLVQFVEELETKSRQYLVSFDTFDLTKQSDQYRLLLSGRVFFR